MNMRVGSDSLKGLKSKEREFITRESPEYQEFALSNEFKNTGLAEGYAFSLYANEMKITSIQKFIAGYEKVLDSKLPDSVREDIHSRLDAEYEKLSLAEEERVTMLSAAQDQLTALMQEEYLEKELVARMQQIMDSDSVEGRVFSETFATAQEAIDVVVSGGDSQYLVRFLNAEAKRFKEQREVAFEHFRTWVNDFYRRAHDPECQQYLKRSPTDLRSILQQVNFAALDRLNKSTHLGHADGSHVAVDLHQIEHDFEEAKHTVFHELAHHVSGVGIVKEESTSVAEDGIIKQDTNIRLSKMGGHFNRSDGLSSNIDRKLWINEALTDLLASKMSGVPLSRQREDGFRVKSGYAEYIDEVWEMVDAGITWDELYDAWAEDMLIEPENGTRIPKYDHLIRRIREVEGRGAMKRHVENIENKRGGMRVNEETGERYRVNPKKLRLDQLP